MIYFLVMLGFNIFYVAFPVHAARGVEWSVTETPIVPGTRRGSWARLLRKILEVDPLLCPRCHVEMRIVSVITEPQVIDEILSHLSAGGGDDPFQERAPPA